MSIRRTDRERAASSAPTLPTVAPGTRRPDEPLPYVLRSSRRTAASLPPPSERGPLAAHSPADLSRLAQALETAANRCAGGAPLEEGWAQEFAALRARTERSNRSGAKSLVSV